MAVSVIMAERLCSEEDCGRPHYARGRCNVHYYRWRRRNHPRRPCIIEGCDSPRNAQGLCDKHYTRWQRHGDPLYEPPSPEELFWARVGPPGPGGCREWVERRDEDGYGRLRWNGRAEEGAHRVAWMLTRGPIPDGLQVCHHCDNEPCCEPTHLFLGTHQDNHRDMVEKRRHVFGEGHPMAKLTETEVERIRHLYAIDGITQADLALVFGIGQTTIHKIVSGLNWKSAR